MSALHSFRQLVASSKKSAQESASFLPETRFDWDTSDFLIDYLALEKEADAAMATAEGQFESSYARMDYFEAIEEKYATAAEAAQKGGDYEKAVSLHKKRAMIWEQKLEDGDEAFRILEHAADFYASIGQPVLARELCLNALAICNQWEASLAETTFDSIWQQKGKVEILLKKAQLLEKAYPEDGAYKELYKQAAEILMEFGHEFSLREIVPFSLAGLCYEKTGDLESARKAFKKSLEFVLELLPLYESEIEDAIARVQEQREVGFETSDSFDTFPFFELLCYSRNARETQFCAAKIEDRGLLISLLEKERSYYAAYINFSLSEPQMNLHPLLIAQYLSLSDCLSSIYEGLDPDKALCIKAEAARLGELFTERLSKKEARKLVEVTSELKEVLENLLSPQEQSIEKAIEWLNYIEL